MSVELIKSQNQLAENVQVDTLRSEKPHNIDVDSVWLKGNNSTISLDSKSFEELEAFDRTKILQKLEKLEKLEQQINAKQIALEKAKQVHSEIKPILYKGALPGILSGFTAMFYPGVYLVEGAAYAGGFFGPAGMGAGAVLGAAGAVALGVGVGLGLGHVINQLFKTDEEKEKFEKAAKYEELVIKPLEQELEDLLTQRADLMALF